MPYDDGSAYDDRHHSEDREHLHEPDPGHRNLPVDCWKAMTSPATASGSTLVPLSWSTSNRFGPNHRYRLRSAAVLATTLRSPTSRVWYDVPLITPSRIAWRSDALASKTSRFTALICNVPTSVSPRRMAHTRPSATSDAAPARANALRAGVYSEKVRLPSRVAGTRSADTLLGATKARLS